MVFYKFKNILKRLPVVALAAFLLFISCSAERKLGKKYVRSFSGASMMILPPDFVYKNNLKTWLVENAGETDKDSILFSKSTYLKLVSDSLILEKYVNSLADELKTYGFEVFFNHQAMPFLSSGSPSSYILNVAQLQLEEYYDQVEDKAYFSDTVPIYQAFNLNAVNLNSWFEISRMNADTTSLQKKLLYASETTEDYFSGAFKFNILSQTVYYEYDYDSLRLDDIYILASYAGKKYASYIYDYLMNQYIKENFPANAQSVRYFHFNKETNQLKLEKVFRFTEME